METSLNIAKFILVDSQPYYYRRQLAIIFGEDEVMDLLGHADIKLTQNIYTHIRRKRKEETAAILNAAAEKF